MKYKTINHGYHHVQYFPGCGTAGTPFRHCTTGTGDTAHEAWEEAANGIAMWEGGEWILEVKNPFTERDAPPLAEDEYYYVSILWGGRND